MRNLALAETTLFTLDAPTLNSSLITSTITDTDDGSLYFTTERLNKDADVVIDVWKVDPTTAQDPATPVASLTTPKNHAVPDNAPQVVSSFVLLEERQIVIISRGGDIATVGMDDPGAEFEVVGLVEDGILAAEWGPDSSLLTLITDEQTWPILGENKLILMTSTFDPLSESPLHTSEFGEDTPINLGWGSKQTQFHGSLGKAAAQSSPSSLSSSHSQPSSSQPIPGVGSSPDDDSLPRISWRADGAYFVVSSLTPGEGRRRVLRVHNREGVLQSTSEPVPGMEHPVAWRPAGAGGMIISTQRFAPPSAQQEGLASGKEGRHDVVFLERNGLRHGEFGMREWERLGGSSSSSSSFSEGENSEEGKGKKGGMRWGYRVREMLWSADGAVLGVWIEGAERDVFQLWTTGNWHWYLKHEITAPPNENGNGNGRFTSIRWHPERPLDLVLTTSTQIIHKQFRYTTSLSPLPSPHDTGTVAVIDGSTVLLTPFRSMNVPPPMAGFRLDVSAPSGGGKEKRRTPASVCFVRGLGVGAEGGEKGGSEGMGERTSEILVVLWETGEIEMWDLRTRIGSGRGKVMKPRPVWSGTVAKEGERVDWREVSACAREGGKGKGWKVGVLGYEYGGGERRDVIKVLDVGVGDEIGKEERKLDGVGWRLVGLVEGADRDEGVLAVYDKTGKVYEVREACTLELTADLNAQYDQVLRVPPPTSSPSSPSSSTPPLYVGLSRSGTLVSSSSSDPSPASNRTLAQNVNSFTIASELVIYTTTAHESVYVPVASLASPPSSDNITKVVDGIEKRRVERGSRIVVAVPSSMSLVLQMPRGNLETINPRAMVLRVVKVDVDAGRYRKAFLACRKHRVDLNVLVAHDPKKFEERLGEFLDQIEEVDYVNLFLTSLGSASQLSPDIVASLCDSIRLELERRDLKKCINSILTAYVVRRPPDHEAGLGVLLRLKGEDPNLVEEAVKYIIFLVDANTLFDVALGMYDFELVLMIAQHAQKDPREYLPFLRELRALEKYYQRFRIDDHLRRYESALRNLKLAGQEHFDEAMAYLEKHRLYELGLKLWNGTEEYPTVLTLYGEYLFERRDFKQAAIVFVEASRPAKAMIAFEKALQWRELMDLAEREQTAPEDVVAMAYRVAEDLTVKKRYTEASTVLLDYANDVREAVIALVQGNEFSEARRVATRHGKPELLEEIIYPGTLESRSQISDEIGEMREQLRKQVARIRELRVKKVEEPDAYYGNEDTELHNVDVMTEASQFTAFTRYTAAPSNITKTPSKISSRSKRKAERKVGSGRKGTVDEEEYLLKSVTKLVTKFGTVQDDASNLIPHLLQFTDEHRTEARELQSELASFEAEFRTAIDEIWTKLSEGDGAAQEPADSWAKRMEERERDKEKAIRDVVKPNLKGEEEWRVKLVDVGL